MNENTLLFMSWMDIVLAPYRNIYNDISQRRFEELAETYSISDVLKHGKDIDHICNIKYDEFEKWTIHLDNIINGIYNEQIN